MFGNKLIPCMRSCSRNMTSAAQIRQAHLRVVLARLLRILLNDCGYLTVKS